MTDTVTFKIKRQDSKSSSSYWETFTIPYVPNSNVISCLMDIQANPINSKGEIVTPVVWESNCLEEVCGACTMVINGRTRQSCTALVDRLLEEDPEVIELQPMRKFPVLRDLVVDRSRLFRSLQKTKCWVPVDGYYDMGAGQRQSRPEQEEAYPLSQCMSCGCCLDACPQFTKVELERQDGESETAFQARKEAEYDKNFVGAHAISQVMLFNANPTGKNNANERVDALMKEGGIQVCGNAQNCVAVCPKEIPLTTSIARAGRATTVRAIKKWFDR